MLYSTIYAVNGAGLTSLPIKTNGFTVDTSPPEQCSTTYGVNILNNYDFSQNLSLDWRHNDPIIESDAVGDRYVSLEKYKFIEQSVITSLLTKYRVTIEARSGGMNTTQSHLDVENARPSAAYHVRSR